MIRANKLMPTFSASHCRSGSAAQERRTSNLFCVSESARPIHGLVVGKKGCQQILRASFRNNALSFPSHGHDSVDDRCSILDVRFRVRYANGLIAGVRCMASAYCFCDPVLPSSSSGSGRRLPMRSWSHLPMCDSTR